jgi:hypothetical protein
LCFFAPLARRASFGSVFVVAIRFPDLAGLNVS